MNNELMRKGGEFLVDSMKEILNLWRSMEGLSSQVYRVITVKGR